MNVPAAIEWQPVAVLLFRLWGILARPLTLPGFVEALLPLAGKHKKLLAGDATSPKEGGDYQKRQDRTGNTS